ncbi:MAG: DUF1573 domain-containing protein [Flavobacteriales bacterium]
MDQRINTTLLAVVAILTAVNTVMIGMGTGSSGNDDVTTSSGSSGKKEESNVTSTKLDRGKNNPSKANKKPNPKQANKQQKPQNPPTTIEFEKVEHDFGTVKAGGKVTKNFSFKNTGDKPYVIQKAKGSCGCTVPKYPKDPIAPGETGEITVSYNPGKRIKGKQTNSVTLTGNTQPRKKKLKIRANVQAPGS